MAGRTLEIDRFLTRDALATEIANKYVEWDNLRANRKAEWEEVRRFVFATDTTETANAKLPWKNSTTLPKLCQIRDNLYANYISAILPKRRWLTWEGSTEEEEDNKAEAIRDYMIWSVDRPLFEDELSKLIYDFIDYGNAFATSEWYDGRVQRDGNIQHGYVGPRLVRIDPKDIVFNPIAPTFHESPKIIRKYVTIGEVKKILDRVSNSDETEVAEKLYEYLRGIRQNAAHSVGDFKELDAFFQMDGFTSFHNYMTSGYAELLTFTGDMYDVNKDIFYENYTIVVVDRHKILYMAPNTSSFGSAPIFSTGWRIRQDNLWAMGPLDNLIGMQYRIDHVENTKADLLDLTTIPPLKIKGRVDDFEWGPMENIYVGDDGDVEMMVPQMNALQLNVEIQAYEQRMEEYAGAPKEAMGFRTPGEKTKFEVQRIENAASRVFNAKTQQFERQIIEPCLNGMLDLATRNIDETIIRVTDDELKIGEFRKITPEEITGAGRLRPMAARHFAQDAERIQNLSELFAGALGQDPEVKAHFSSVKLAMLIEEIVDIKEFDIVEPFIRIQEQAEAQRMINVNRENVINEMGASGLEPNEAEQAQGQEAALNELESRDSVDEEPQV